MPGCLYAAHQCRAASIRALNVYRFDSLTSAPAMVSRQALEPARSPQTPPLRACAALGIDEPVHVLHVRLIGEQRRPPFTDHAPIDQHGADPDVGEQPPVPIASIDVLLDPHPGADAYQAAERGGGLSSERFLVELRGIHPDQTDAPDPLAFDPVTVGDALDGALGRRTARARRSRVGN